MRLQGSFVSVRAIMLCAVSVCVAVAGMGGRAAAQPEVFAPDEEGFIRDWLIAGPYPNPRAEPEPQGFTDDLLAHLGGEAGVIPYAGMTDEAVFVADRARLIAGIGATNEWGFTETRTFPVVWTPLHWREEDPIISLDGRFGEIRDWLAAFAACWVHSPVRRSVQFRVGSDDGYKLYVNHELIGGLSITRAAARDQNLHPVQLNEGLNLVLLKITEHTGQHAFCLRITDPQGKPYDDLEVVLSHPATEYAARCENLDEVDVVDGEGFARIRLGAEPRLPGPLPMSVMLGLAEPRAARVQVLVTDGGDREVHAETFTADLGPTVARPVEATVGVARPGPVTVGVLVQDAQDGAALAHLQRTFEVLDPAALVQRRDELRRTLSDRRGRRDALAAELTRVNEGLEPLREAVAEQYRQVEALYARRREVLAERHGEAGRSVDEPFAPAHSSREVLCLNGDAWEYAGAISRGGYRIDEDNPPEEGWLPGWAPMIGVERYFRPSFFPAAGDGGRYHPTRVLACAPEGWTLPDARIGDGIWYRTTFEAPERWAGRRVLFTTEYASDRIFVFLNGELCGTHTGWPGRIAIDLGEVSAGPHELLVLAQRARSFGGTLPRTSEMFGLMGDVFLTAVSDVAVTDTWVITSWRNATIETRVWLLNRGEAPRTVTVEGLVAREGRTRLNLGRREITLAPGVQAELRLTRPWTDPEPWGIGGEYGDPALHHLVTTVTEQEEVLDQHFTRFGFREVWQEGFHFYLNGRRLFIQGDNVGARSWSSVQEQVVWQQLLRESANINAVRTHFEFQQGMYARVADELGMLIIAQWYPELFIRGRPRDGRDEQALSVEEFLTTEEHHQNLRRYADWVRWLRNHPSVVVYTTDNEIYTQAWDTPDKLEANIRNDRIGAVYGRYVGELDPTRLVTRSGDVGTWGWGKWQEDPPAPIANYHYPDFNTRDLVENWETKYGKPVLYGETLYCAYGAWDGWIDAIPSQVAGKALRCRRVLSLYRDLEIPGWVGMGIGLDGFTELKDDGSGNPWGVSPALVAEYKANERVESLPHYPYFPVRWPSLSGPGLKPEFHRFMSVYGFGSVNSYFADRPVYVANAVNAAYKDSTRPMPPLAPRRPTEALITVTAGGEPLPHAVVWLMPQGGQACPPVGVRADAEGRAWFVLEQPGRYEARVEGHGPPQIIELDEIPFRMEAGFGYLPRLILEVQP